jgi:hypothetical protein
MTSCLALMTFWLTAHGVRTSTSRSCCTCSHACRLYFVHRPGLGNPFHKCALVFRMLCNPESWASIRCKLLLWQAACCGGTMCEGRTRRQCRLPS